MKAVMPRMSFDYGLMLGSGKSEGCNICRGQVVFLVKTRVLLYKPSNIYEQDKFDKFWQVNKHASGGSHFIGEGVSTLYHLTCEVYAWRLKMKTEIASFLFIFFQLEKWDLGHWGWISLASSRSSVRWSQRIKQQRKNKKRRRDRSFLLFRAPPPTAHLEEASVSQT